MTRREVFREIKERLGNVPLFFKTVPDRSLEWEWSLFKTLHLDTGSIPDKYRALAGVAVATATRCRYIACFHIELARRSGATDAEIEDSVHFAKSCTGWSAYLNGMQVDYDRFRKEIPGLVKHLQRD